MVPTQPGPISLNTCCARGCMNAAMARQRVHVPHTLPMSLCRIGMPGGTFVAAFAPSANVRYAGCRALVTGSNTSSRGVHRQRRRQAADPRPGVEAALQRRTDGPRCNRTPNSWRRCPRPEARLRRNIEVVGTTTRNRRTTAPVAPQRR
jgi:hypothetical protein